MTPSIWRHYDKRGFVLSFLNLFTHLTFDPFKRPFILIPTCLYLILVWIPHTGLAREYDDKNSQAFNLRSILTLAPTHLTLYRHIQHTHTRLWCITSCWDTRSNRDRRLLSCCSGCKKLFNSSQVINRNDYYKNQ